MATKTMKKLSICLVLVIWACCQPLQGEVRLPKIFTDHMVLQQELPIAVWGWADKGEKITVTLAGKSAEAKADAAGKWRVDIPAMKADGKAHTLTVKGSNTIERKDVLLGEVWLCAGQSNMNREVVIEKPLPNIRLF